jgi:hypothetical protein
VRNLWFRHLFGVATLTIAGGAGLYLGETHAARFGRTGGQSRARQAPRVSAELVCTEWITYCQGTKDHTSTKEVNPFGLSVAADPTPDTVCGRVSLQVPPRHRRRFPCPTTALFGRWRWWYGWPGCP